MDNPKHVRLAKLYLHLRSRGGTTAFRVLAAAKWRLLFVVGYFAVALLFLAAMQFWNAFNFMLGLFVGVLLQTLTIARRQAAIWPFVMRVTDWERVEQIASGESSSDAL